MSAIARRGVVIGTGLIGSSLAAALRAAGAIGHVVGVGRGLANLQVALRSGFVDSVSQDPFAAVTDADLVVLATPVDSAVTLLPALVAAAPAEAIFTDVGSVKRAIVEAARVCGIEDRFVGAHPIAGGTMGGAGGANPTLFRDRTVVLTPSEGSTSIAVARIRALWEAAGARVIETTAHRHDEILALTSHLPQFVVFALCATIARADEMPSTFFGAGFRDTTRLATSDHEMWLAIARLNRDPLVAAMDGFSEVWTQMSTAIANGDDAALLGVLSEARAGKERSGT